MQRSVLSLTPDLCPALTQRRSSLPRSLKTPGVGPHWKEQGLVLGLLPGVKTPYDPNRSEGVVVVWLGPQMGVLLGLALRTMPTLCFMPKKPAVHTLPSVNQATSNVS